MTLAVIVFLYSVASEGFSVNILVSSLLVWFLPTLYLCMLAFYGLAKLAGGSVARWVFCLCAIGVAAPIVDLLGVAVCPIRPETVLAGLLFFCLGHVWRLVDVKIALPAVLKVAAAIVLVPVIYMLSQANAPIAMYGGSYGFWPLFYLTALVGTVWVCLLGRLFEGVRFFSWFGQVSVIAFVLHFRMIAALRFVALRALPLAGVTLGEDGMALLLLFFTLVFLIPLVWACDRKLGFLFGK